MQKRDGSGFWLKTHGLHEVGVFHRDLRSTRDVKELRVEFEKRTDVGYMNDGLSPTY
jgi:hypothetical protein